MEKDVICPKCDKEDVAKFNDSTGVYYCKECKEISPADLPKEKQPIEKKKSVALLLCLFLGWLGAHRFYEKKIASGILYLGTFGIFGLGIIVDFIRLLKKESVYYVEKNKNTKGEIICASIFSALFLLLIWGFHNMSKISEGIDLYKNGNYEQSVEILSKQIDSSETYETSDHIAGAYYLSLGYEKLGETAKSSSVKQVYIKSIDTLKNDFKKIKDWNRLEKLLKEDYPEVYSSYKKHQEQENARKIVEEKASYKLVDSRWIRSLGKSGNKVKIKATVKTGFGSGFYLSDGSGEPVSLRKHYGDIDDVVRNLSYNGGWATFYLTLDLPGDNRIDYIEY